MSDWRFTSYDLRTGDKVTDLNVQSWESTDVLSDAGSWSATVELDGKAATADTSRRTVVADGTRRGRSLIVAERDGVPVFAGIVWRRSYDARSRLLRVAGRGLLSYFDRFVPRVDSSFTATDQFAIVRALVALVQDGFPGGDVGIEVTPGNSGVTRDRPYPRYDGLTYGDLIRNLSRVENGFDMDCRVEYDAGQVERWLRLWYPRRGRDLSASGVRFRAPGNAVLFDMDEDASDMAVTVVALGAGDGPDMLVRTASRLDLVEQGWPGYTTQRAYKDVTSPDTLVAHAAADADRLSGVDAEVFTVQVDPAFPGQPYGAWDLGDDCWLIVDDDPLYPAGDDGSPGLAVVRRVVSHQWRVTSAGEELVVGLARKVIP